MKSLGASVEDNNLNSPKKDVKQLGTSLKIGTAMFLKTATAG